MRRSIIAANWKLNASRSMVDTFMPAVDAQASASGDTDIVICPPYPYLDLVGQKVQASNLHIGGQTMSLEKEGAFTGEVSADMLRDMGCRYVILGHSEQRRYHADSDISIGTKMVTALRAGLTPIVCIGESLQQRKESKAESTIMRQLGALLALGRWVDLSDLVIAYEPIWAIGTGETASPEQAQAMHAYIRAELTKSRVQLADTVRVLYGGSVNPDNAAELFAQTDIDGGLIGGASLQADSFNQIITAV